LLSITLALLSMPTRPPLVVLLGSLCAVALGVSACGQGERSSTATTATDAATSTSDAARLEITPDTASPDTSSPDTVPPDTATPSTGTRDVAIADAPPRVLIDTDLGGEGRGATGAYSDPDDIQSLVRAVHYSDALGIEGIVSTHGPGLADPELIREWIRRTDVDHLREQGYTDLMTEDELLAAVKSGTRDLGGPGEGRATEGSSHIITRAHAGTAADPLWILTWGSLATVAQALHDDPSIVPKIRLYSIGDYNSDVNRTARDFVRSVLDDHPEMWWIENAVLPLGSRSTYRGVFEGGNQDGQWDPKTFVERHIRGHGTTADGEFSQKLGDAFPGGLGSPEFDGALKEGDSPSMLYLLSPRFGDVGDLDDPTGPSWGGQFRQASPEYPNYHIDLDCPTPEQCAATINRHRVDFLSHWRDRWDRYDTPSE
jgi:hypothetical protein